MSFKKINHKLNDILEEMEITTPTPFQELVLAKIRSGADYFCIAPKGSGKTISIVISVIQRLLSTKPSNAPRALIYVKDRKSALELQELFNDVMVLMDLEVYSIFESQHIYNQKDAMYFGVDIVITTPGRMVKLYEQNGINVVDFQFFILEDAHLLVNHKFTSDINRISESIKKCQYLVFADEYISRFDDLKNTFMNRAKLLEFKEDLKLE